MAQEHRELLDQYIGETKNFALGDADQRPLWQAFRRRQTDQLRLHLHRANLYKVVRIILKEFARAPHNLLLEILQDSAVEMWPAIDRYDPDRDVPFGAYVKPLVITQARRTYRRLSTVVRFPHTHGDIDVPGCDEFEPDSAPDDDGAANPEDLLARAEQRREVEKLAAALPPFHRRVFRQRALAARPQTIEQIAEKSGRTRREVQSAWDDALVQIHGRVRRIEIWEAKGATP